MTNRPESKAIANILTYSQSYFIGITKNILPSSAKEIHPFNAFYSVIIHTRNNTLKMRSWLFFFTEFYKRRIWSCKMKNWTCQPNSVSVLTYGDKNYCKDCCWKLVWTVKSGTEVLMGCIYHITFSLSALSTDTWHCFSNFSMWADSTELRPWLPRHYIPIATNSIPVKHR